LETGDAYPILQIAAKKIPELSNVSLALDVAKTEEARQLLKAGAIDPGAIVRVYVTTPRTPKDRLLMLRTAFAETLTDPDFVAETKKINLDINPLTGAEVKKIVDGLFKLNPSVVSKLANILAVK
jgi:hypothetical protein